MINDNGFIYGSGSYPNITESKPVNLINAQILKFENGEDGVEPAIAVKCVDGSTRLITITNSKRFRIGEEQ